MKQEHQFSHFDVYPQPFVGTLSLSLSLNLFSFLCDFACKLVVNFHKISCMTRVFPAQRLLQTPNGWNQHVNPSRVLQEYMNSSINVSGTPINIVCEAAIEVPNVGIFLGDNPLKHSFSLVLFNLLLVTTITRIVRFLLKPLRQPKIISQIIVSFPIAYDHSQL